MRLHLTEGFLKKVSKALRLQGKDRLLALCLCFNVSFLAESDLPNSSFQHRQSIPATQNKVHHSYKNTWQKNGLGQVYYSNCFLAKTLNTIKLCCYLKIVHAGANVKRANLRIFFSHKEITVKPLSSPNLGSCQ